MTRVYLVRHGQTEWNKSLTFRGRIDIPLNERGHREAEAIAEALKDKKIDAIYTSPLRRSIETTQPTAKFFNLEIRPFQGLIDINYGDWEGLTFDEVKKRYEDQYKKWEERTELEIFTNGENKVLLCSILGLSNSYFWEIKQDAGCINLIEYSNERFVIALMNDTCHLKGIADGEAQPDF